MVNKMKIHKRNRHSIKLCEPTFIIPCLAFIVWKKKTSYKWYKVTCKKCLGLK